MAIIGAGMVAETHLAALAELSDHIQVIGVNTRSEATGHTFASRVGELLGTVPVVFETYQAAASDPRVDWAIVLTPPDARLDVVRAFAGQGKGLLLEKPIERTFSAARDIVEICEVANVPLGIVFQHRARDASVTLAGMIDTGAFGRLAFVEASVPWWREQAYYDEPGRGTYARDGGGVLVSQAIHTLDLMLSLSGQVAEVQAMAATTRLHDMEAEDYVVSGLHFECGAVGSLVASTASYPGASETLTFHLEKAVARLVAGELRVEWRDGRIDTLGDAMGTGGGADPMAFTHDWHRKIIEDFSTALRVGRDPMVSGREALKVHALIDALTRSAKEKRSVSVDYPKILT